jgi:S1-C subfamily serine protease
MVRICVETPKGDRCNGAGFHIGKGVIVTVRHVIEENRILELQSESYGIEALTTTDVIVATDTGVDLAVLKTNFQLDPYLTIVTFMSGDGPDVERNNDKVDHVPIGLHLNDWISDEFVLSKVLVMGYPRIPLSREIVLVTYPGEVSAVVDTFGGRHPYFVISLVARGGFSGGSVISEHDFLLGVVTQAMVQDGQSPESGYFSLLTVEPLLELLAANGIRPPGIDDETWDLFAS